VRASDDAAAMFVSEQMRSQIVAYKQANRNVASAASLLQVMEGGLETMANTLTRLKELAIEAADGSYSGVQREKGIQVEADQLVQEMERILKGVQFNGIPLFPATASTLTFQVGEYIDDKIGINLAGFNSAAFFGTFAAMFNQASSSNMAYVQMPTIVDAFMTQIQSAINLVVMERARLGAVQNRLERTADSIAVAQENTANAESVIRDADMAQETAALIRAQILAQAGTAVLSQAYLLNQNALSLLSSIGR
jgi:flagellin